MVGVRFKSDDVDVVFFLQAISHLVVVIHFHFPLLIDFFLVLYLGYSYITK